MSFDAPTVIALIMLLSSFMSTRMGRRASGPWRSSYAIVLLAVLHLAFLYQFPGPQLGRFSSEVWAAISAAAIAGIAADDDADAVGLLLIILGAAQILVLSGLVNLRPT